ncbi:MAG: ATP-dependent DNA helicase RecG [Parcubacteria group bacterium]|nr:ATP-dependent DNA helicase RecG [Parcubacteria group bacterium]
MSTGTDASVLPLSTRTDSIPRIQTPTAQKLKKIGIRNLRDLLFHIPTRYEDYSQTCLIKDAPMDTPLTISGVVDKITSRRIPFRKLAITEVLVRDDTGTLKAVWFNQPYLAERMRKGISIRLSGKITLRKSARVMTQPLHEITTSARRQTAAPIHTGRFVAIYPETSGITSRWFRYMLSTLLPYPVPEFLPPELIARLHVMQNERILESLHFPKTIADADKAKERLIFNEIFLLQLTLLEARQRMRTFAAPSIARNVPSIKRFVSRLPFALTPSQRRSIWEIASDMAQPYPMNRLLEGDVGSGKTVVAGIAGTLACEAGYQTAFLAPTEILASQHFKTLSSCTDQPVTLLTASLSDHSGDHAITRDTILARAEAGSPGIYVGTHALIQKSVRFGKLGLVVVDEQHRFGVEQRKALLAHRREALMIPHLLSMSATPIPRTLAITVYGDLDLSILEELPPGRQPIATKIVSEKDRAATYEFIREEIKSGRQAFVVCPRIEKNEIESFSPTLFPAEVKNVTEVYEELARHAFPEFPVVMLHGKMAAKEKERIMRAFTAGNIALLVSTSVIEVGVDVPNASVMFVESADRFGLAQLYQLRGRIGRGEHAAYCFYATNLPSRRARERLNAILRAQNGFELAQKDLEMRGPGEFFGTQQSGLSDFVTAHLANTRLVYAARSEARRIVRRDPYLSRFPHLAHALKDFHDRFHRE